MSGSLSDTIMFAKANGDKVLVLRPFVHGPFRIPAGEYDVCRACDGCGVVRDGVCIKCVGIGIVVNGD
jgi:hypothetical protein